VSKRSTEKKDMTTSRRDVSNAERPRNSQEETAEAAMTEQIVKCSRQYVLNVESKRRFLSSQIWKNQYIAKSAIRHAAGNQIIRNRQ
jgi:hypothetical protein